MGYWKLLSLYAVPILLAVIYSTILLPPQQWASETVGNLMGEWHVSNSWDAHNVATLAHAEAVQLWNEPNDNWAAMHNASASAIKLVVQARRVTEGPHRDSGMLITRASGIVPLVTPNELYRFLTSPEGLMLLNPSNDNDDATNNNDNNSTILLGTYEWKNRGKQGGLLSTINPKGKYSARLEIIQQSSSYYYSSILLPRIRKVPLLPFMKERFDVTLNGYDYKDHFYFCKSIIVPDHDDPSSPSAPNPPTSSEDPRTIRAIRTMYLRLTPVAPSKRHNTKGGTQLEMIHYQDDTLIMGMVGTILGCSSSAAMNWKMTHYFYPRIYQQLKFKFAKIYRMKRQLL
mmetsp:Transcript_8470/g.18295  ORF Transcript_8470/g.18295 Transcript_8470/m.18295 type:complete len:344 (+) Transcript_8470:296-1327(+)